MNNLYSRRHFLSAVAAGAVTAQLPGLPLVGHFLPIERPAQEKSSRNLWIVAHRGAMSERPENTIAAYSKAVERGADSVEIDLRTSKDGKLFVLHDSSLERTTDGKGAAAGLTLAELQQLDAGSWFDAAFEGARIPAFHQVLRWAAENRVSLLLDLKEQGVTFSKKVADDVRRHGVEEKMVVGVRTVRQAQEFRELLPHAMQLAFMRSPDEIQQYSNAGVDVIRLWLRWLEEQPDLAEQVHQTGKKLMINGTDGNPEEAQRLLSFDPDWVLIDDLKQLQVSLQQLSQTGKTAR